jgi:hypothetical protein
MHKIIMVDETPFIITNREVFYVKGKHYHPFQNVLLMSPQGGKYIKQKGSYRSCPRVIHVS